jgi:excisionase family DNA binding protein
MTKRNIDLNRDHIKTSEAAELSHLSKPYLTKLLRGHVIEGFQMGREWFIYTDSLEAFLKTPRKSGPKGPRKKRTKTPSSQNSDSASLDAKAEQ